MNRQDVEELIISQEDEFFFTGGVTEELIHEIEKELNVQLPESYKWFLSQYGYGGINGVLIQGVGLDKSLQVVNTTLSLREYGLPNNLVVIENIDEYVYCFNLLKSRLPAGKISTSVALLETDLLPSHNGKTVAVHPLVGKLPLTFL